MILADDSEPNYPVFGIEPGHDHVHKRLTSDNRRTAPLHHRDIIAMLIVILRNVMARVAASNDDGLFPLGVRLGFGELA